MAKSTKKSTNVNAGYSKVQTNDTPPKTSPVSKLPPTQKGSGGKTTFGSKC
jgi:hypothetical protein